MRNVFLIFISIFVLGPTGTCYAKSKSPEQYRKDIAECESQQKLEIDNDSSTDGMSAATSKAVKCLEQIGFEIIDDYYTENSKIIKKQLSDFIVLTKDLYANIFMGGDNGPYGTMHVLMYQGVQQEHAKKAIEAMLNQVEYDYY